MHAPFRSWWQRLAVAACAALAIGSGLIAAAPIQLGPAPVLVVFPFQVGPGLQPAAGVDFAARISAAIASVGGVNVSTNPSVTSQSEFTAAAKSAGADFYLTGFVSPVGRTVTVIQQLVSVRSGTIIWSNSAQVLTSEDATEQANLIRGTLLQYASRGFLALSIEHPTPPPSAPRPKPRTVTGGTSGSASNASPPPTIGLPNEAYGFSSAPTAQPRVYASAAHPSRYAVLTVAGKNLPADMRDYAANALIFALGRHGQTASLADPDTSGHPLLRGGEICAQTGASMLVWGSLGTVSTDPSRGDDLWTTATMTVYAWDCKSGGFERGATALTGSGFRWKAAIDHAADAAVSGYLLKLPAKST